MKHYRLESASVVLAGGKAVREFLELVFSERNQELMIVAFCDEKLRLIQSICVPGNEASVQVAFPDIFRLAVEYAAILVAHNHPSGDPRPSQADLRFTRRLCDLAECLDVTVLDHLIFGRDEVFSFRKRGLL